MPIWVLLISHYFSSKRFVSKQLGMETDDVTLDHMIQAADKDKDGTVSYREFVMVLMRK